MTQGSASHREDVEQLGRRFEEFHAVRTQCRVAAVGGVVGCRGEVGGGGMGSKLRRLRWMWTE